ncbi:MAG: hypothetical protein A4E71_02650 [Smithella sp. PtaU1.Bin162]|nr:MAG: hypothetical protein A4E71_02650 [Smithella sp. PtaU1.Bin162]
MKIIIQAMQTPEMTPEEIKKMLTPEEIKSAKGKMLVSYTIAEEGQSYPKVIGAGNQPMTWPRAVIKEIVRRVKPGTNLYSGHNKDNSTSGRPSVGTIIKTFAKDIGGKLRSIAIACMNEADAVKYDVCSIEANVTTIGSVVSDILRVTGLAVGNSKSDTPAFENARRMAMVQAFTKPGEPENNREDLMGTVTLEDLRSVPISLIRDAIRERQMHPNQLFDIKDIEEDKEFGKIIVRTKELETELENSKKLLKENEEKLNLTTRKVSETSAKDMLKKLMPEKITDMQRDYINLRFKPEDMKEINEETVKQYIEDSKKEFAEMAKIFKSNTTSEENSGSHKEDKNAESLEEAFNEL